MITVHRGVGVGTRFSYDGQIVEVIEMHSVNFDLEVVVKNLRTQQVSRMMLADLLCSDRSQLMNFDLEAEAAVQDANTPAAKWDAASESARTQARRRAEHVREVLTGFKAGHAELALPHEPYAKYRPTRKIDKKVKAKANELHVGVRTVRRWISLYRAGREAGLLSGKAVQPKLKSARFTEFEQTPLELMQEYTRQPGPTAPLFIDHALAQVKGHYGPDNGRLPSLSTAYRSVRKLEKPYPTLDHSTTRNRDIAARSIISYGKRRPMRPGEYVLMDSTRLDVYAAESFFGALPKAVVRRPSTIVRLPQ